MSLHHWSYPHQSFTTIYQIKGPLKHNLILTLLWVAGSQKNHHHSFFPSSVLSHLASFRSGVGLTPSKPPLLVRYILSLSNFLPVLICSSRGLCHGLMYLEWANACVCETSNCPNTLQSCNSWGLAVFLFANGCDTYFWVNCLVYIAMFCVCLCMFASSFLTY